MKKVFKLSFILIALIVLVVVFVNFYSYIFSRRVEGRVEGIKRVNQELAILGGATVPASQLFSFAVAIKEPSGEIVTASAEDRQWAVVKEGQCAEAIYYPYPPWQLSKSGTYFGARLIKLYDCPNP